MKFKEKVKKQIDNEHTFKLLEKYVALIEKHNKFINLTGFSGDRLWQEGIYESIISLKDFIKKGKLLDIGAGAGFPSIPILIFNPKIDLTIYEPIQKRIDFLSLVKKELNLKFNLFKLRAEESKDYDKFDFVTARAVAPLKILIEISYNLAKNSGSFIWLKGPKAKLEINDSKKIIDIFKIEPKVMEINIEDKVINSVYYIKNFSSPKGYPRKWSVIKKENKQLI